ncbi:MAG TPA: hypothetical protein VHL85_02335 [Burkholderiales bacterium]|jgi:hypothetical protein|nr:hypothetical protein [Burkholderiales bacterium]
MFSTPLSTPEDGAPRRIRLEELIAKLSQIEEHASLALSEHPRGQILPRLRLILGIARQARLHLEHQASSGVRVPVAPAAAQAHLPPPG